MLGAWPGGPATTRCVKSLYPWSNSWLPTDDPLRHISFITSMVGWSWAIAELNSEAPMRSPAPRSKRFGSVTRSFSIVVAHLVVRSFVGSMRPWKSLMLNNVIVTGAASTTPDGAMTTAVPTAARAAMATAIRRRNFDLIVWTPLATAAFRRT
jgi:hypothetical protein